MNPLLKAAHSLSDGLFQVVEVVRYVSPLYRRISVPSKPAQVEPPLALVRLKYDRAHEQFDALNNEIGAWLDRERCIPVLERNRDLTEYAYVLEFRRFPDLHRWATLAGEILFNLRSALDHLVYALAVEESGLNPPENFNKLQFPIADTPKKFRDARGRRLLTGLSEDTIAFIEGAQPYEGRNNVLAALRDLNDIDKHRALNVVAMNISEGDLEVFRRTPEMEFSFLPNVEPLEEKTRLLHITFPEPYSNMGVKFGFTLGVSFWEGAYRSKPMMYLLLDIHQEVLRILHQFDA